MRQELADRVVAAAEQLDYHSNGLARGLRRRRTNVWALIISDIANPFFTAVARGAEDAAQRAGYSIVLCNSDEDPAKESQYLTVAERDQVAGVIMSPNAFGSDISRLRAAGIPVVAIDRPLHEPVDTVLSHSREGAREATRHLLEQGWRRPACITGPRHAATAQERRAGYVEALAEHGGPRPSSLIRHADYRAESAREALTHLLGRRQPPDSLFIANAPMALGVLEELAHRGLRPGTDIGLIAFDDAPWAPFVNPPLSVVAQPAYEIGLRAGNLLLDRVDARHGDTEPRTLTLPTELIIRASSVP